MKVHEYQAKQILAEFDVPLPRGRVALSCEEARTIAAELRGKVVVKAQIHAGGRGKAGGVKLANNPDEADAAARGILGRRLVTHQTGPEGVEVHSVLVEEAMPIERELYLAIVLDREESRPVVMASEAGGMDIEEVAAKTPEKILKVWVDPTVGFQPFQARQLAFGMHLPPERVRQAVELMRGLYRAYIAKDCSLAEINPLVVTADGRVLALDAKLNIDDNGLFRHPEIVALRDTTQEDPLEVDASKFGINYIRLDGTIGCMVNGAGLAMATMDIIKLSGGEPANFLDVGGGARTEQVENAFRIILSDPKVNAVLVNIFGGITRCDVVAQGIIEASRRVELKVPLVVRLVGTNVEEGRRLLAESGLPINTAAELDEAACKVVAAAKG